MANERRSILESSQSEHGGVSADELSRAGIREHAVGMSDQDRHDALDMVKDHGDEWKKEGRKIIEEAGENAPATSWNGTEVYRGTIAGNEVEVELGSAAHSEKHLSIRWKTEGGTWKEFQLLDI